MTRKHKPPAKKPSKAYLVSFGDTMTALLAFFIVINSLAKDQTGANLYVGTGSFVRAFKRTGVAGNYWGTRSNQKVARVAPTPIYAIPSRKQTDHDKKYKGPDEEDNRQRVISRQYEDFKRFLDFVRSQYQVMDADPIQSQVVFDSFERLDFDSAEVVGPNALQIIGDAIGQLASNQFEIEIVIWAKNPSESELNRAMNGAVQIEAQIDRAFQFRHDERSRLSVAAKPWLFADAKRPRLSVVLSRRTLRQYHSSSATP